MAKKTYILDTSVYLTDANSIESFGNNDIIIPFKVLEEVDNHKKRQDSVGSNARRIIRILDTLREKGSLYKGVRLGKGKGILSARAFDKSVLPQDFDFKTPDNEIIGVALNENKRNPNRKVILVSRDINMRVKCDALGLMCEDYVINQVVKDTTALYRGFKSHLVDDELIDQFYNNEEVFLDKEEVQIYPNEYLMLVSNSNDKKTALARFSNHTCPLKKINGQYKKGIWGVKSRNKEQNFALDLLMDPDIPVVTLVGKAGSGPDRPAAWFRWA